MSSYSSSRITVSVRMGRPVYFSGAGVPCSVCCLVPSPVRGSEFVRQACATLLRGGGGEVVRAVVCEREGFNGTCR